MKVHDKENQIRAYYAELYRAWGRQHWWPASTAFEVIVGAYLTQNTAWTNVKQALRNLRAAGALSVAGIRRLALSDLEELIRPSGYFRQKARSLKTFIAFLDRRYGGSLRKLFAQPTAKLREELLDLNGVGPETADSILLYAGNHPVFVVDAYTRRLLDRHGILSAEAKYEDIRNLFESALRSANEPEQAPTEAKPGVKSEPHGAAHLPSPMSSMARSALAQVYNEMHGLIVGVGKNYCRKAEPDCDDCPLKRFLPGTPQPSAR